MAWNRIGYIAALSLALIFAACSGDSENSSSPSQYSFDSDMVVESLDALPICTKALEGTTAYVKIIRVVYICKNDIWMVDAPYSSSDEMYKELGSSSSENTISSSSFVVSMTSSDYLPLSSFTVRSSSSSIPFEVQSSDSNESSSSEKEKMDIGDMKSAEDCLNSQVAYGKMVDARDGRKYKTVKIGRQMWMAQNLNYADSVKMPSLKSKSWYYNNETANCDIVGRLYTWSAAMDSIKTGCGDGLACTPSLPVQGACPDGWHLPSKEEWDTLFTAVGGQSIAGKVLKSKCGWYNNGNGNDAFGFAVLPAGYRSDDSIFDYNGNGASFWSSTRYNNFHSWKMYLYSYYDNAYLDNYGDNNYAFSIRCLKD